MSYCSCSVPPCSPYNNDSFGTCLRLVGSKHLGNAIIELRRTGNLGAEIYVGPQSKIFSTNTTSREITGAITAALVLTCVAPCEAEMPVRRAFCAYARPPDRDVTGHPRHIADEK